MTHMRRMTLALDGGLPADPVPVATAPVVTVPVVTVPVVTGPALLARVAALRDGTEEVFLSTGTQLIDVAALLDAAKSAALSLDHLAQVDLISQLRTEAAVQSTAFAALVGEIGGTRTSVAKLAMSLGGLTNDLQDVRRSVVTMRIVVLNARVTLASLQVRDANLSNFTVSGQAVVAETSDLLLGFETTMAEILRAVDQIEGMVARIGATLTTDIHAAFQSLMETVAGFEQAVRAVSGRGADLSRNLQLTLDATSRAVSGLQIGDSTRQQLDHIAFILAQPDGSHPALRTLAANLLRDAAQVHAQMLAQLSSSVTQMTDGLTDLVHTHLVGFLQNTGQTVDADTLAQRTAHLAAAIGALHPLQQHTQALGQTLADQFATFRSLIAKGETVQQSTHLIGINAVLSCMRLGSDGAALKVVAEQLQVVSREVGGRLDTIRAALGRTSQLGSQIISETDRLVHQSIDVPERLIGSISPMIRTVVGLLEPVQNAAAQLQGRMAGLVFDFTPAQHHCDALVLLAASLPDAERPLLSADVTDDSLAQIYAVFTIEREREIFRALMPDRADAVANAVFSSPQVESDDGFFF